MLFATDPSCSEYIVKSINPTGIPDSIPYFYNNLKDECRAFDKAIYQIFIAERNQRGYASSKP